MKRIGWLLLPRPIADCSLAVLSVAVTTVILASILGCYYNSGLYDFLISSANSFMPF